MVKRLLLMVLVVVCCCGLARAENGLTIWGLTSSDAAGNDAAMSARVGYQYEFVEAFAGSTWHPNFDPDTGDISPPQVFSLGALAHMADLVDPNNPLPWIPPLLLTVLPEKMVLEPYFGYQGTINIDQDAGFTGAIVGVQAKLDPASKSSVIAEIDYDNNFIDLGMVPDNQWTLKLGFRFQF